MIRRPSPLLRFLGDYAFELFVVLAVIIVVFTACGPQTSSALRYPLVVIAESPGKETGSVWRDKNACLTVIDADGDHYTECGSGWVASITACYNVGDTIR